MLYGWITYWFHTVKIPQRGIQISHFLSPQTLEISDENPNDRPMPDKQHVIGHSFDFNNHCAETIDDVEVPLTSRTRIAVVKFVLLPQLIFSWEGSSYVMPSIVPAFSSSNIRICLRSNSSSGKYCAV